MRVGIGIMLSVLSFSVLAAVIPNYDSHGILLVRRAISPDNHAVSWSKSNGDQVKFVPSSSEAGASAGAGVGGSNLDYSSDNRGSSKLGRFQEFLKGLYRYFKKSWNTQKQKYARWSGKRSIQKAIKKLTEIVQGQRKKEFISEINNFLNTALESARMASGLYDGNAKTHPFFLTIPKDDNQQALLTEMTNIQNDGKKVVKGHLADVTRGIDDITKSPRNVVKGLAKIIMNISGMLTVLENIYYDEYTPLISKVKGANNEAHIKAAEKYITEMKKYRTDMLNAFDSINDKIKAGGLTFKRKTQSRFGAFKSGVKERLRIKKKSSTGVTSDQEESNQGGTNPKPSNQESPGQKPSDPKSSNPESPGQKPSDPKSSNQESPGQKPSDPKSSNQESPGQKPSDPKSSNQESPGQKPSDPKSSNQESPGQKPSDPKSSNPESPGQKPSDPKSSDQGGTNPESSDPKPLKPTPELQFLRPIPVWV